TTVHIPDLPPFPTRRSSDLGTNARVRATIHAQIVVIQGKLDGKVHGSERVELRKSAVLVGDIFTQRIAIEEGAYFKGGVDITKRSEEHTSELQSRFDLVCRL